MASPNLSEIVTTTLRHRSKKLADNVTNNNALLARLKERGRTRTAPGGRTIVEEISYAENGTYKRYSGYEVLDVSPSDVFTAAEYEWKQAAVAVTISGLEQLQNSGPDQMIDLLASRIENAEDTFSNNLSTDIYSDGTADGGKQIGGLQLLIADTPTSGTVGGIDRATWPFWRNFSFDATTDGGAAASATTIQSYMNKIYLNTTRNSDSVDLIIADNNYYEFYWNSLQAIQRINETRMGEAGFRSLKFMGADVVFDGGISGSSPTDHMYFINSKFMHYRPHVDRNVVPIGGDRMNTNQDALVRLIAFAGNICMSGAQFQGVLKD